MTTYAAPAARPLTILHVPEPGAQLDSWPWPLTRCGLPMDAAELWTEVERQDGDRVCLACTDGPGTPTQEGIF